MWALLTPSGCSLSTDTEDTIILEVAETRVGCLMEGPAECYLVRSGATGELELFYEPILGFSHTPGLRYTLLVKRSRISNPPQDGSSHSYRLERMLSQEPSPRAELLAQVAAAEARWLESGPVDYEIRQQRVCFCGSAGLGSVRLEVTRQVPSRYDRVTAVERVSDGSTIAAEVAHEFRSVQRLFDFLRQAIADDAHRIDVEFHETAGYPLRISVDRRANVSDDEVEYVVESVSAL